MDASYSESDSVPSKSGTKWTAARILMSSHINMVSSDPFWVFALVCAFRRQAYVYMCACACVHVYICMCLCVHASMYTCTCPCTRKHVYVCECVEERGRRGCDFFNILTNKIEILVVQQKCFKLHPLTSVREQRALMAGPLNWSSFPVMSFIRLQEKIIEIYT